MITKLRIAENRKLYEENSQHLNIINLPPFSDTLDALQIERTENNSCHLRYEGRYLYSKYEPHKEIDTELKKMQNEKFDSIVLFGLGTGNFIRKIKEAYPETPVLVVELNQSLFAALLSSYNYKAKKELASIPIFVEPKCEELLHYLQSISARTPYCILTRLSMNFFRKNLKKAQTAIQNYKSKNIINENTLKKFSTLWKSNIIKNACLNSKTMLDIYSLENSMKGMPAMLCAAGPSLDRHIQKVKTAHKKMPIIAVDTAVSTLTQHCIVPDYIVTVDPQYINSNYLDWNMQYLKGKNLCIVADIASSSRMLRFFNGVPIFIIPPFISLGTELLGNMNRKKKIDAGGSVTTMAWNLAQMLGIKKLFTIGLDFCLLGNRYYSRHSYSEEKKYLNTSRVKTVECDNIEEVYNRATISFINHNSEAVLSTPQLKAYAQWFTERCPASTKMKTLTLEPQAVKVNGIELTNFTDIYALPDKRKEIEKNKKRLKYPEKKSAIAETILEYTKNVEEIRKKLCDLLQKKMLNTSEFKSICAHPAMKSIIFFLQFEKRNYEILKKIHSEFHEIYAILKRVMISINHV